MKMTEDSLSVNNNLISSIEKSFLYQLSTAILYRGERRERKIKNEKEDNARWKIKIV